MTGTGKTEILVELQKKGYPILDLERIAAHRGSLFGSIGFTKDGHNQKVFDSLLFESLQKLKESSYFIVRRRAGELEKLDGLMNYMKKISRNKYLYTSIYRNKSGAGFIRNMLEPNVQEAWFHETILEKVVLLKKRFKK